MATLNGGRFIADQLRSVLSQSRRPDEIVVSDDGSSDSTLDIIRGLLDDARALGIAAVLLDGPQRGVAANFEHAITRSTGDIIVLSDQDDLWYSDRLAASERVFRDSPDLLLHHTDARLVDGGGAPRGGSLFRSLGVRPRDVAAVNLGAGFSVYIRRNIATGAVMAFRRQLFDAASPFPDSWVHDEWLAIIASTRGRVRTEWIRPVEYRQHDANQIGVTERTIAYRFRRMLADRPDRNARLAERSRILADRLKAADEVDPRVIAAAVAKADFETSRASFPPSRLRRVPLILRYASTGDYGRYASQGLLDVVRDIVRRI